MLLYWMSLVSQLALQDTGSSATLNGFYQG